MDSRLKRYAKESFRAKGKGKGFMKRKKIKFTMAKPRRRGRK